MSHNPNDTRERYCGACHRFVDEGIDSLLSDFLKSALDTHAPHVDSGEHFSWVLDEEEGCLRCPADGELVVPSVQWLDR